ncbi:head-tail connector protein [Chthonobacter rhizosphaerae]|uniref:head-tail connector protein n=1 Tax=Chthonobacter rhizosphaerae TaxID=2735553 RepID=UPI0015EE5E40|nr:hypothetical protein [Chthonobacter rhizosphaerae]
MSVSLLAVPAVEPVSLADLKAHLRVTGGEQDVALIALTVAARATLERLAGRHMISQGWRVHLDALPPDGLVTLPLRPVRSVTAVRVIGAGGEATVVPPSAYTLDRASEPARLRFTAPVPRPGVPIAGVEVDLVTGYGTSPDSVPEPLRQAVRLLAARWYETRADGSGSADLPDEVVRLADLYRVRRLVA